MEIIVIILLFFLKDVESWTKSGVGRLDVSITTHLAEALKLKTKDTVLLAHGNKLSVVSGSP